MYNCWNSLQTCNLQRLVFLEKLAQINSQLIIILSTLTDWFSWLYITPIDLSQI